MLRWRVLRAHSITSRRHLSGPCVKTLHCLVNKPRNYWMKYLAFGLLTERQWIVKSDGNEHFCLFTTPPKIHNINDLPDHCHILFIPPKTSEQQQWRPDLFRQQGRFHKCEYRFRSFWKRKYLQAEKWQCDKDRQDHQGWGKGDWNIPWKNELHVN